MDPNLREILDKHWQTLVRYINPTDELINILVEDKALPASMIEDIKKGTNRKEKNEMIVRSIKLRGNISYRKFREAMVKCGQIFLSDLLYESETPCRFVEESDFTSVPSLKLSLSPVALQQLATYIDAKVRSRMLKNDWKEDSQKRIAIMEAREGDQKGDTASSVQHRQQAKELKAEVAAKNDVIRTLSLKVNILNEEISAFTLRHTANTIIFSTVRGHQATEKLSKSTRFSFFDKALSTMFHKMCAMTGDKVEDKGGVSMVAVEGKLSQVQKLIKDLESTNGQLKEDIEGSLSLLLADNRQGVTSMVSGVHKFIQREQQLRYSLLKDIDRLSRKLRGMTLARSCSGLHALSQSAVTGLPPADIVDYRFLSNHLSLLEEDAEHLHRKLGWKDGEIKSCKTEIANMRKQIGPDLGLGETVSTEANSHENHN